MDASSLAKMTRWATGQVRLILEGKVKISTHQFQDLAAAMDVDPPADLMEGE